MSGLRISRDLRLPLDVAGEAIAVLAKRGAGKTNTATVLVEELVAADVQTVIVDPVGAWWGIRSSAAGEREAGLSVPILGGQHGDVPLEQTAGALIADVVVDSGQSILLDLSDFPSKAASNRFVTDFAERLFAASEGWQEILCLSVLAYMGPRRSAAARARRRDVNLDRGTIRFLEKGGKPIVKPIPDELAAIIRAADQQHVWASPDAYLIPSRRQHRNRERSAKVIYDTVKKVAARAGVRSHVHALRAAFAVRFDEQNPGRLVGLKELLGHSRVETTMVYLRRQDKAREMETVRGLSWGSVFPHDAAVPPAGFEPALQPDADGTTDSSETLPSSLPLALRLKLDELRDRREATADRP